MFKSSSYILLAPVLVLACTGRPADPGETAGDTTGGTASTAPGTTGPDASTAEPTTTAATITSATLTAPFDSSGSTDPAGSSTTSPPPDLGPLECDPFLEDCPEGQKCAAYSNDGNSNWNAYKCVPIAPQPGQAGDPCTVDESPLTGLDTCDKHLMCWDVDQNLQGSCVPMCTGTPGDPMCDDPNAYCAISGDGVLILCLQMCDPLLQDCEADETCVPDPSSSRFVCVLDLSQREGQVFDVCEFINVCEPGLTCMPPMYADECNQLEAGCCLPFCDLTLPNDCPGAGQICLPWFENDAPPKYENVGVCALPP